jgi:hypothetical protein
MAELLSYELSYEDMSTWLNELSRVEVAIFAQAYSAPEEQDRALTPKTAGPMRFFAGVMAVRDFRDTVLLCSSDYDHSEESPEVIVRAGLAAGVLAEVQRMVWP